MSHSHHPVETHGHAVETHDTVVERDAGTGMGMVLGLVLVALLIGAVLWVAFAGAGVTPDRGVGGGQGNVNPPADTSAPADTGGPNITIPRQIDVNLNQGNGGGAQGNGGGESAP